MNAKCFTEQQLKQWVETITQGKTVYAPHAKGTRFAFQKLTNVSDLRLDYDVTILPPKKYFQPQRETLMKFTRSGEMTAVLPQEAFVLFGVHPYDMEAINQMDLVFGKAPSDAHYQQRRANAAIVVMDPQRAAEATFAGYLDNATAEEKEGYDLLLSKIAADCYLAEPRSDKGSNLLATAPESRDADDDAFRARDTLWATNRETLKKAHLKPTPTELPAILARNYEHPIWQEKAERCYSCGACTLVCPTCYCFNVSDDVEWDLEHGERLRHWDGCLLTKFAAVAGDHNFRKARAHRFRHRYYRKGKYMPERTGRMGCVGCGRCTTACTAKIADPVEVFNRLAESDG